MFHGTNIPTADHFTPCSHMHGAYTFRHNHESHDSVPSNYCNCTAVAINWGWSPHCIGKSMWQPSLSTLMCDDNHYQASSPRGIRLVITLNSLCSCFLPHVKHVHSWQWVLQAKFIGFIYMHINATSCNVILKRRKNLFGELNTA